MNTLYYGDNLDVMHRYLSDRSVDLIYLDPPFKSGRNYNVIFKDPDGTGSAAQVQAFRDTWRWDTCAARAFDEAVRSGGALADTMMGFRQIVGHTSMLAYLAMMAPRLVEFRRVLKPNGSIYLHCDPNASHYLKILMDSIFRHMFRSEIIWAYKRWPTKTDNYQHMHDVLLYYADKKAHPTFNQMYEPPSDTYDKRFKGESNRLERGAKTKHATGKKTPGLALRDVWNMKIIPSNSPERSGFRSQKPLALLKRVLEISSNRGDLVLDPFCGCGTGALASQMLGRQWVGIDITHYSTGQIKSRLLQFCQATAGQDYCVVGEPKDLAGARQLAQEDRHQFEFWALGLVGARASAHAKGPDQGIDGKLLFQRGEQDRYECVIISVKSGHVSSKVVSELRGVVEREKAALGVLITLEQPTEPMRREAASAGFYEAGMARHQKLQILTIAELLNGAVIDMPSTRAAQ